ncbi:MAG: hypothetical protein AAFQ68_24670 [Bacteroidota bacterium]
MELKVRIGYEELLKLIQQLPKEQISLLKKEIEKFGKEDSVEGTNKLKQLALSGPLMTEEQFGVFQDFRKELNKWRL